MRIPTMRAWAMATISRTPTARARCARGSARSRCRRLAYGEGIVHHGVRLSLHPAGHVLGSAQVRLEHGGRVWVASGDYKTEPDGTCAPFEPVPCDTFITESTFGLPIYRWPTQAVLFAEINDWWRSNAQQGRASVLLCYAFGKAQRILHGVDASIGPIVVHGAVEPLNEVYRAAGVALPPTLRVSDPGVDAAVLQRALVLAPPSAQGTPWMRRFGNYSDAFASGWMQLRGTRRRRGVDRGFVMSDHADWPGLQQAIAGTGAERVFVTHGSVAVMVRWLSRERPRCPGLQDRVRRRRRGGAAAPPCSDAMKQFAALYRELDATTSSLAKQAALQRYLQSAAPEDAAWAVYFLAGGKPRQLVPSKLLRLLAQEAAGLPEWLFDESYEAVGDLARDHLALAAAASRNARHGPRGLDRAAPAAAAQDAAGRAGRCLAIAMAAARGGRAARVLQAHHRRLSRRRVAAAGHAGAGGGRRARSQARRAAAHGLHAHQRPADALQTTQP